MPDWNDEIRQRLANLKLAPTRDARALEIASDSRTARAGMDNLATQLAHAYNQSAITSIGNVGAGYQQYKGNRAKQQ